MDQLIAFAADFSRSLAFRGENGETGSWDVFFLGDPARSIPGDISFIIADIASADPRSEYLSEVGYFNKAQTSGLLKAIHAALKRLDLWRERLALAKADKAATSLEATLSAMVDTLIEGDKKFDTVDLRVLAYSLSQNPKYRDEWSRLTQNDETLSYWFAEGQDHNPFEPPGALDIYGSFNRTT
ncbi:MAG: hypothetical protein JO107_04690, partial [Hyphomicrobiales bacterium]|nr:hypothetical protein [Hyphomicrobiales bacterium]